MSKGEPSETWEEQLEGHAPFDAHQRRPQLLKTANYIYWLAQLGHRELSMTPRYAHLSPDHMRAVADLTLRRPKAGPVRLSARRQARIWGPEPPSTRFGPDAKNLFRA